jgi:hypothetical protein
VRRVLVLLAVVAAGLIAPRAARAAEPNTCEDFAQVFYSVARYKQRGDTKESQAAWMRETFGGRESREQLRAFLRVLDFVYASDAGPREIRSKVLESCTINASGQAVLRVPKS